MAIEKDDIIRLTKVQEHDKLLDDLRGQIAKIPEDIEILRAEISGDREQFEHAKQKCKEVQARKKEKELEMAQKEGAIKKHEGELNSVKTNDAFKALLKEIEEAKKGVGDLETAIIEILDEIDAAVKAEKAAKAELDRAEGENNKQVQVLEGNQADLEKRLGEEEAKRPGLTEGIPDELMRLYDQTRERRGGVALSDIRDGVCHACNVKPTPQTLIDLRKGKKIVTCDNCQRILYEPVSVESV